MGIGRVRALELYGARQIKFAHYARYLFTFEGDGLRVVLGLGTLSSGLSVDARHTCSVSYLMTQGGVTIWEDGKLVYNER